MKKKISRKELIEIRKKEQLRKELEYDLHTSIESDYRAQDKYLESGRLVNFITGVLIGFFLLGIINRFVLASASTIGSIDAKYSLIIGVLKIAFVGIAGYLNMKTMGKFVRQAADFIKGMFK